MTFKVLKKSSNNVRYLIFHISLPVHREPQKRATLFLIITLAFLGRFFKYFLYQWKQEILYKWVNKIYHFTLTVSPHYLAKLKLRINSHFKSIVTMRSIEPVVRNFRTKSSNVRIFHFFGRKFFYQSSSRKLSHSQFFK